MKLDSIAAIVLSPQDRRPTRDHAARSVPEITPGSIADEIVVAAKHGIGRPKELACVLGSSLVYAIVVAAIAWFSPPDRHVHAREAARPMAAMHVVELQSSPSVAERPMEDLTAPPKRAARSAATRTPLPKSSDPAATPPPPAETAEVLAAANTPDTLDLTELGVVSGKAEKYAGGTSAAFGTNTAAVDTATVDPHARPGLPQGEGSLARTVRLPERSWRCPWPEGAVRLGIHEQAVLIRVEVDADGHVSSTELLSDPGHGFGEAALACARAARFNPALDERGEPYLATSPPIRVRFSR